MQHILVHSDSLSWGIVPTTRRRLPFESRWPGVMELTLNAARSTVQSRVRVIEDCLIVAPPLIETPRGPIAVKFTGAAANSAGLADAYRSTAAELGCHFFDSVTATRASSVDGIHLDADQHEQFGQAIAEFISSLSLLQ